MGFRTIIKSTRQPRGNKQCSTFRHWPNWPAISKMAAPAPYAGIPVSIKDLFDIRGQVTRAGSRALEDSAPAEADAAVVARLRGAGFVVIGRTNMTEFAYSGIGINPHYGTPQSVWRRDVGHVPGGSSSGAAVSVADR